MSPVRIRVREIRQAAGLSQTEVAGAAGITVSALSRIELGKTTRVELELLDRLAIALDVPPGELLHRVADK